jgi:hypothetical protein
MLAAAAPAGAVVKGSASTLGSYTVRLVGNGYCSGAVIARRAVVTAAHCAHGMRVLAGGRSFRVSHISRSGVLDDSRRVSVSGDAAILQLSSPLPETVAAVPVGDGGGDSFTIAGYGSGSLREATLVAAEPRALVDPHRTGSIGASACFGDSGGPVLRGGMLVGVITRAAHPSPRIACGYLTRWAPISVSGEAEVVATKEEPAAAEAPRPHHKSHQIRNTRVEQTAAAGWFGNWFAAKAEPRRSAQNKTARR